MKKMLMGFVAMLALISVTTARADEDPNNQRDTAAVAPGASCPYVNSTDADRNDSTAPQTEGGVTPALSRQYGTSH